MPNRVIGLDLSIQVCHHVKGKKEKEKVACGLYKIVYSLTLFTVVVIVQISVQQCPYALGIKRIMGLWVDDYIIIIGIVYVYPYGPGFEIDYV